MPRRELSPEQLEAAHLLDLKVALTAGAGTGKTSTLVERFTTLIRTRRAAVSEIAAVTFTEKAANELKGRVHGELKRLAACEADPVVRRQRREDLVALETAQIGTIHGFCAGILREFCVQANLDPEFHVIEEVEAQMLASSAVRDALFAAVNAGDLPARRMLEAYEFSALCRMLEAALARRADMAFIAKAFGVDRKDSASVALGLAEAIGEAARERVLETLFSRELQPHISLLEKAVGPVGDPIEQKRRSLVAAYELLRTSAPRDFPPIVSSMLQAVADLKGGSQAKWQTDLGAVKDAMKALRKALEPLLDGLEAKDTENWKLRAQELLDFNQLYDKALEEYNARKRQSGFVDFDDLLILARDLVVSHREVAGALAKRYQFILVDEFQDTDYVQYEVINAIAAADANLFVVGDREQSIYGFRGARIEVFSRVVVEYEDAEGCAVRHLRTNHRTQGHILSFINALFGRLMPPGSKNPWRPSHEPLTPEWHGPSRRVEVILALSERDVSYARRIEAQAIARRIRDIVDSDERIVREEDADGKVSWRAANCGDVAILFRSMSSVEIYERELLAAGIRYYTIAGATFYLRQEVKDVINLLRFVVDSSDSLSLVGALRSPLFAVSDDCLALLSERTPLARCFDGTPVPDMRGTDVEAFRRAVDLVGRLRALAGRESVRRIVDTLLDETSFCAALSMLYAGRQRVANVLKLRDAAAAFDAATGGTLSEFVGNVSLLELEGAREGEARVEDETTPVVRLMTVHAAKGLEFPIVVVADMGRRRNPGGRDGSPVLIDRQLGVALPGAGEEKPPYWKMSRDIAAAREAEEETRIFYVAATRARNHLILSGAAGGRRGVAPEKPEGWIAEVLDALEVDPGVPKDHDFEGFTVQFSCPRTPVTSRRREKAALLSWRERLISGGRLPGKRPPEQAAVLARSRPLESAAAARRRFTATELADFCRCPLRYELLHLRGLPADFVLEEQELPVRPGAQLVGLLLHEVLEKAAPGGKLGAALDRVLSSNPLYAPAGAALRAECVPILERLEASGFYASVAASPGARSEMQFSFALDKYLLEGKIDLCLAGRIVDYKSDDVPARETAGHAESYRGQMDVYALACERLLGRAPDKVTLYFLRPGVGVDWDYGPAGLDAARARVLDVIRRIHAGPPYAAAETLHDCRCEYGTLCALIRDRRSASKRK